MRRRRPMLTVRTRPALISAHIVVLPTPTSLQAVFTETAKGLAVLRMSEKLPVVCDCIARTSTRLGVLCRVETDASDCGRALPLSLFVVCRYFVGVLSAGLFIRDLQEGPAPCLGQQSTIIPPSRRLSRGNASMSEVRGSFFVVSLPATPRRERLGAGGWRRVRSAAWEGRGMLSVMVV